MEFKNGTCHRVGMTALQSSHPVTHSKATLSSQRSKCYNHTYVYR